MVVIEACRDFLRGLARGMSFFLTERHDGDPRFSIPEAALAKCLQPPRRPHQEGVGHRGR